MGAAPAPFHKEGSPQIKGEDSAQQGTAPTGTRPLLKGVLLVIFILAAISVVRFTPIQSYFTPAGLGRFLERTGIWGPVVFALVYAAGVCLYIPGTLLTTLGGAIFGVGVFIFTFFVGTVRDVWASGDWRGLLSLNVFFSVALFVFSFFLPRIIKKIKGE